MHVKVTVVSHTVACGRVRLQTRTTLVSHRDDCMQAHTNVIDAVRHGQLLGTDRTRLPCSAVISLTREWCVNVQMHYVYKDVAMYLRIKLG